MGMFDNLICREPLPDGFDCKEVVFQTKGFECALHTYTIKDRRLWLTNNFWVDEPEIVKDEIYHGEICFDTTNICMIGHGYVVTTDNEKPWWREYKAKFNSGQLQEITGGIVEQEEMGKLVSRQEFNRLLEEIRAKEPPRYTNFVTRQEDVTSLTLEVPIEHYDLIQKQLAEQGFDVSIHDILKDVNVVLAVKTITKESRRGRTS